MALSGTVIPSLTVKPMLALANTTAPVASSIRGPINLNLYKGSGLGFGVPLFLAV